MRREPRKVSAWAFALGVALGACDSSSPASVGPAPGREEPADPDNMPPVIPHVNGCTDTRDCPAAPSATNTQAIRAEHAPPPISGGTLLLTRDQKWLVAADPDRDQLHFVDVATRRWSHTRALQAGDEPGRSVEDAAGQIHVVLRGGRAIASLTAESESTITRREVCALPRGLAFDAALHALHVACADGKLVRLPAAVSGEISQTSQLERDLRDVVLLDDRLYVTRFRSAELLKLDAAGGLEQRFTAPVTTLREIRQMPDGSERQMVDVSNAPTIAWRSIAVPGKGIAVLHQRARVEEVAVSRGGYGGGACGGSIVQTSVTVGMEGERVASADLVGATLAVDLAVDPTGTLLAIAAPGNWAQLGAQQVHLYSLTGSSPLNPSADPSLRQRVSVGGVAAPPCLASSGELPELPGQVTAVTFVSSQVLAVQEREPAAISFIDVRSAQLLARVDLGLPSRFDTGHALFHLRTPTGLACASCHPEATDDAHVWTFAGIGPRRTQDLRGGILGTEPLHWDGDMRDFSMLVERVLAERMAGFQPVPGQVDALAHWIDSQPAPSVTASDTSAAARGKTLFESETVGCASCHSGKRLTNNGFAEVGTGGAFQVPSLRGVSFRVPLMHDGCAASLRARFDDAACGGTSHGSTAQLSSGQLDDLIAYLETL